MRSFFGLCGAFMTAVFVLGCDRPSQDSMSDPATPPAGGTASVSWVMSSEPPEAIGIVDAKAVASEGDRIVIRGRIGGRREPLTPGSAVFTVMDLALPHCGDNPDDKCPRPWDYCCETPETIRANAATVQIVDSSGAAVAGDASAGGLKPLDEVVVVGTVGPRPSPDVLLIQATGVFRIER